MTAKQLSDGDDEGVVLGQSTTDKVSFHGADPVAQTAMTLMVTAGATTPANISAALLEVYTALKTKGIVG